MGAVQRKEVGENVGESEERIGRQHREGAEGIRKRNERCTTKGKWDRSHLPDLEDSYGMKHLKKTPLNSPAINLTRRWVRSSKTKSKR